MPTNYDCVKVLVCRHITRLGLKPPAVTITEPGDSCDVTDAAFIRLHCRAAGNMTNEEHAAHVVKRWLKGRRL